jgi:predicted porin
VWYQFGKYVDDQGTSQLLALKTQYRFSKLVSAYLLATGQKDVDVQATASYSGTVALGLRFRF